MGEKKTVNRTKDQIEAERKKIKKIQDFIKDLEAAGGEVPAGLKKSVNRFLWAIDKGLDVADEAENVSIWLKKVYEDLYAVCKAGATTDGIYDDDQYYICKAQIDRKWQARNIDAVLNWNNDKSLVRRLWDRWKKDLADLIFSWGKDNAKKQIQHDPKFTIDKDR
jgi:hypothetical protein